MKRSIVSCIKLDNKTANPEVIFEAVKKVMELNHWEKHVQGKNIILKINVMWDKLYPSCTTTPMVIEGIIKVIRSSRKFQDAKISIVDTNTVSFVDADTSFMVQGIKAVALKNNVKLINLSRTKFSTITCKNAYVLKHLRISRVLLNADSIITIPVPKTHAYAVMTCALKNQWGCIHEFRHNYHLILHPAIVDINRFLQTKVTFGVVDALFAMEGEGPKNGTPKYLGYLFASSDLVALDTTACEVMGIDYNQVTYISLAEKAHLGRTHYKIVGDTLPFFNFRSSKNSNLSMKVEMRLRKISPFIEKLFFNEYSPFLLSLRITAKIYYDLWYQFVGKKKTRKMMKTNFGQIWKKYYLDQ